VLWGMPWRLWALRSGMQMQETSIMGNRRTERRPSPQRTRRTWRVLAPVALLAVAAAGTWWASAAQNASGGTPRLVVDRSEIDLGRFPYEGRARAVFTLTNAGDVPLRIVEVSPVKALKGC